MTVRPTPPTVTDQLREALLHVVDTLPAIVSDPVRHRTLPATPTVDPASSSTLKIRTKSASRESGPRRLTSFASKCPVATVLPDQVGDRRRLAGHRFHVEVPARIPVTPPSRRAAWPRARLDEAVSPRRGSMWIVDAKSATAASPAGYVGSPIECLVTSTPRSGEHCFGEPNAIGLPPKSWQARRERRDTRECAGGRSGRRGRGSSLPSSPQPVQARGSLRHLRLPLAPRLVRRWRDASVIKVASVNRATSSPSSPTSLTKRETRSNFHPRTARCNWRNLMAGAHSTWSG